MALFQVKDILPPEGKTLPFGPQKKNPKDNIRTLIRGKGNDTAKDSICLDNCSRKGSEIAWSLP